MPGPLPKPTAQRRRTNKVVTARKLVALDAAAVIPKLPFRGAHPLTEAWWRDIWSSPMAPEFIESDIHGLYLLAALIDEFWKEPSKELAGEIRLQRQCFGLTPIDRRRLQWEIDRGDEAVVRAADRKKTRAVTPAKRADPRLRRA